MKFTDDIFRALPHRLSYRIRASPVRNYPFSHFLTERVFDDEIADAITRYWPAGSNFTEISNTSRVLGGYQERMISPLPVLAARLHEGSEQQTFWSKFYQAMSSDQLIGNLLEWLWPMIKTTRDLPENIEIYPDITITDDKNGYAIGPHTDAPHRLVTILFYVPEDDSIKKTGTSIYVPKNKNFEPKISGRHHRREQFDEVFRAPFLPNSGFGFIVSPTSYHGAELVSDLKTPRRQLQYSLRYRPINN